MFQVHLQTQQEHKLSISKLTINIIKKQGVTALYNGLSASLLRQLTYSTVRFGAYEVRRAHIYCWSLFHWWLYWYILNNVFKLGKQTIESPGNPAPFYQKFLLAGVSGAAGGVVGTPADLINVRMQNDVKIPLEKRRK